MKLLPKFFATYLWLSLAGLTGAAPVQEETPGLLARMLQGPMKDVEEIVLCERAQDRDGHWYANFGYQCHEPNRYVYGPGGGKLFTLNLRTGEKRVLLDDPAGSVRDPVVSYDGRRILFSYRPGQSHQYHLYEMNADGTHLTQLTHGDCDDFEPCYLPDGGIMFVSSRCYRWVPCWYTQVGTMYRCEADGSGIRQISFGVEHENTPCVLPDGRVLYTRWEYVDRHTNGFHHLWTVNPDGTSAMVYYGNVQFGRVMIDAKPIPGSDKIAAIFNPGHGKSEHQGDVMVVDVSFGTDNTKPVPLAGNPAPGRQINEIAEKQINRHTQPAEESYLMSWRDVLPFSEDCFLVCSRNALYVMDGHGNFERIYQADAEIVHYTDENGHAHTQPLFVNEPRVLAARPKEPVAPNRVDDSRETGVMVLADVYEGRKMEGVERGDIKKLLILEELPKPLSFNWSNGPESHFRTRQVGEASSLIIHRVIGTVPVEDDGSAHFEAPAQRPLFFVALDENDVAIKRMQSFTSVMPGEQVSCVGCHERRTQPPSMAYGDIQLSALTRPASWPEKPAGVPKSGLIDFPRDIQPILDRHCVECHRPDKAEGGVRLDGGRTPNWTFGYSSLIEHQQTGMEGKHYNHAIHGNIGPRSFGSPVSELLKKARGGHHDVAIRGAELSLLKTWVDSSANFAGAYVALVLPEPHYPRFTREDLPESVVMRRCASCHLDKKDSKSRWPFVRDTWIDLEEVQRSYLVRAPLAREAGGLGLCRERMARSSGHAPPDPDQSPPASIFPDTDDPDYQAWVREITDILTGNGPTWKPVDVTKPTYWQEGFEPHPAYARELIRYGVLPPKWQPTDETDWFAIDEAYYRLFYPNPKAQPHPDLTRSAH